MNENYQQNGNNSNIYIADIIKVFGKFLSFYGEILIIIQSLLAFSFYMEINTDKLSYLSLIPIIVIPIIEFLIWVGVHKRTRFVAPFSGFIFFLYFIMGCLSFYLGGGWFFGAIFMLIGGLIRLEFKIEADLQLKNKSEIKHGKRKSLNNIKNFVQIKTIIFLILLIAPIIFAGSSVISRTTYRGNIKLIEDTNGEPNYNNTLYMLPIWETMNPANEEQDMLEVEKIKSSIGGNSKYYQSGFSVSCWYVANLENSSGEWNFNPTMLYYKLNISAKSNTPILFHMNGGNWGACGLSNALLRDLWNNDSNIQYDQFNSVPPVSPFAGCLRDRLFSLQLDTEFNHYREKFIKQAASIIVNFAEQYPNLFVGVSLDSEIHLDGAKLDNGTYLYYDYNPKVINEYREWLAERYSIDEYKQNYLSGVLSHDQLLSINSFNDIDAPRIAAYDNSQAAKLWKLWTTFRHYLVKKNVEFQSKWLFESGIPKNKIYSHQILSEADSFSANYLRCDSLDTVLTDYCVAGITRYNYIDPSVYWNINSISGMDWGIFEWNVWKDRESTDYYIYMNQLKAMYQAGVHVLCPNGWFEYVNPRLMIRNNTIFQNALKDFADLVRDVPRGTAPEGRLDAIDYLYVDVKTISEYLDDKIEYLLIPLGIVCGVYFVISIKIKSMIKKTR